TAPEQFHRVLGFTLLVSVLVGLVSGRAPSFTGPLGTLGNSLVVFQIGLAMLVLAAGLLAGTWATLPVTSTPSVPGRIWTGSQPPELFHRFLDGFEFLDVGVHGVFLEVHVLGDG